MNVRRGITLRILDLYFYTTGVGKTAEWTHGCMLSFYYIQHVFIHIKSNFSLTFISKHSTLSDSEMNSLPSEKQATSSAPLEAEIHMCSVIKISSISDHPPNIRLYTTILYMTNPVGPCQLGFLFYLANTES